MLANCLAVGAGGAIGAIGRYLLGLLPMLQKISFPFATLLVNLIGAFLIGLVVKTAQGPMEMNPHLLLLLKVGICGGFTTFSTFSLESLALLEDGKWGLFALYVGLSLILCIGGTALGKTFG